MKENSVKGKLLKILCLGILLAIVGGIYFGVQYSITEKTDKIAATIDEANAIEIEDTSPLDGNEITADAQDPQITLSAEGNSVWAKSHSVVVTLSDNIAGLASGIQVRYGWSTSNTEAPSTYTNATITYSVGDLSTTFTANGSGLTGKYYLWVEPLNDSLKDTLGHILDETQISDSTFYFDNRGPWLAMEPVTNNESWRKEHQIKVTAWDGEVKDPDTNEWGYTNSELVFGLGLKSGATFEYGWSQSAGTLPTSWTTVDLATKTSYSQGALTTTYTFTTDGGGLTGKWFLHLKQPVAVQDVLGNSNQFGSQVDGVTVKHDPIEFYFDNTAPTATFSPNPPTTGTRYVKGGTAVTVTMYDEHAGLISNSQIQYQWVRVDASGNFLDANGNTLAALPTTWSTLTGDPNKAGNTAGVNSVEYTIPASQSSSLNGIYKLYLKEGITKDNVGDSTKNTNIQYNTANFYFDNTIPTITLTPNTEETWFIPGRDIQVSIKDNEGAAGDDVAGLDKDIQIQYQWTTSTVTPSSGWQTALKSGTTSTNAAGAKETTRTIPASASANLTGVYYLHIKAGTFGDYVVTSAGTETDNLNAKQTSALFRFDNTLPTITLGLETDTTWAKSHSVTVTLKDSHSGLGPTTLNYGWSTSNTTAPDNYTAATPAAYTEGTSLTTTFTANGSGLTGKYYLWVVPVNYRDAAENDGNTSTKDGNQLTEATVSTGTFYFDNTKPVIGLSPNTPTTGTRYVKGGVEIEVRLSDEHAGMIKDAQIEYQWVKSDASPSSSGWLTALKPGTATTNDAGITGDKDGTNTPYITRTIPTSASSSFNGTYKLYIREGITKDNVRETEKNTNTQVISENFYFDNEGPKITTFSPTKREQWLKAGQEVAVTITDNLAGFDKDEQIEYQWVIEGGTPSASNWKTTVKSGTTNANNAGVTTITRTIPASGSEGLTGKYYLCIKEGSAGDYVVTSAGAETNNTSESAQTTGLFWFDNSGPVVTFNPNNQLTYSKQGAEVEVTFTDNHAGLAANIYMEYKWIREDGTEVADWARVTGTNVAGATSTTRIVPASASSEGLTGEYYLHIRAGTASDTVSDGPNWNVETVSGLFRFDNVGTRIEISPTSQENWTKGTAITVTGTDDDSGLQANAKIQYQWVLEGETPDDDVWIEIASDNEEGAETTTWEIPKSASSSLTSDKYYHLYIREGTLQDNVTDTETNYNLELISGGFHFDAEKPIIEFVANSQPDSYTRATPQVEVRISDEHSGLSSNIAIQYQWILVNAENKAIDASGNILTALPNSWSTVTGTNTAGITGVSDTSNTEYITRIVPAGAKTGVTGTYSLFIKAGCVRDNVTDSTAYNVNNVANSDIYKLDYTKPTVTFSPNEQTSYSKRIPEVVVTLSDEPAGLKQNAQIKYQWILVNEGGEPIDENGDVLAELPNTWTTKTATNAAGAAQTTITITTEGATYTGYYKLYVKAGSVIDNVTDSTTENSNAVTSSAIFKFDNENPEIVSFTPNSQTGSWSRGAAVTVTAQDYYSGFASDVTLEYQWVLVNDAGNPISASGTVLGTLPTSWTTLEASEVTAAANYGDPHIAKWVIEKNISAGLSGKYKLYIKEGSVADNVTETTKNTNVGSSSSGIFQFDNKSPVITFDITTTGENWVKGGQPVKVTATDIHSGLIVGDDLKMEFQWVAQGQTPSSSNWISSDSLADPERPDEHNATWTIPASYTENLTGIYKLYIRAEITKDNITDTTKNSNAEASTEEFKFDNTKPNKVATSTIKLGSASGANYPHEQEPLPWTSSDVYVKPNNDAEDQHSGVKESIVTILKDGEEYTPTNDLLLETGTYEITIVTYDNAIDSSGNANPNTDTRTYTIKIDKDKPIITTITPNSYGDNNTWIRGHEVVVTAKDDLAGLKANAKIQYQWVKQGQTPADDSWTEISSTNTAGALETTWTIPKSESQKDTINGKYILYIREGITQDNVLDTVGNGNSQKTSGIFYFDNEKPSITFSIDPAEDWIRGEQPLTVTATDTYAGLIANAQIQYQWVIEGQTPSSSKWVQLQASNEARVNSVTWSVEMKDSNGQQISSGRYILYIREGITKDNVTDTEKNANAETTAGVFKFDNTAPNNVATMTIKLGNSSGTDYPYDQEQNWTKSDVYIALNDNATDEHSGVKQSTFAVTKDGEAYTPTGNLLKHTGTYTITVTTEDNAVFASGEGPGNIATRTYTVRIDKEAPVVTGFAPESQTGVDSWSRGTEVTVTATDTEAGFISNVAIQYQWVKEGEAPVTANWTLITATDDGDGNANTTKWVVDKTASATLTGEYRLYIKEASINDNVIDSAKNTNSGVSKSGIFYFDNSAPEITFDINTKTDWVKDGQKIIVTATDANAGLIKDSNALLIQYQWVVDGSAPTSGGWSSAIAPFEENVVDEYIRSAKWEVPASSSSGLSGTYKLYIKSGITKDNITDSTKNSNIQASTGTFNFDNIIPNNVATMNFKLESTTGSDYVHGTWTNKDVYMSLNDDAEDAHSGVRESTYTVLKDGAEYTPVDEVLTETGVYTITVTTEDNAVTQDGNEPGNTAARTYTIQIDKVDPISKPLIMKENNASGADYGNDTWTKEDVYIEKVDGEDQAELSGHKITYYTIEKKQDDGTYEIYSGGYSGSSGGTGSTSSTLASVTNANIGDYIDLGNNIVGGTSTSDDWRILYVEGNKVYAILADYLPNSTGYAASAGLDTSGTYGVYSDTNRDTLLNGLTTSSYWRGLANGISGTQVTGTPTAELLMNSYNTKNGTSLVYTDGPTLDSTTEDYELYFIYTEGIDDFFGCWLASAGEDGTEYVCLVDFDGGVYYDTCYNTYYGIRPVVALPNSTSATKVGDVWTVEGGGAPSEGVLERTEPSTLTETGEYKITVSTVDNANNIVLDEYTVKIDKEDPTVGILTMKEGSSTGTDYENDTWTKESVYIELNNGEDEHSGHSTTTYSINGGAELTEPTTLTDTGTYTIVVTTTDNVGLTSTYTYTVKIDKLAPIAGTMTMKIETADGDDYTNESWTNQSIYIAVNDGSDAHSDHKTTTYTVNGGAATSEPQVLDPGDGNVEIYEIVVTTWDNVDNTATRDGYTVKIDKKDPTVGTMTMKENSASGEDYENDTWTKESVYIAVNNGSDDDSGHKTTVYTVNGGEATTASQILDPGDGNVATYEIVVTTTDIALNTSTDTYTVKIDKKDPTVGTISMIVQSPTEPNYINDTWVNESVYIELHDGSDDDSGHKRTTYTVNSGTATDESQILDPGDGNAQIYTIIVTTWDNVDNTSTYTYTVKIDKKDPTVGTISMNKENASGEAYENDTWTNKDVYIEVNAGSDEHSGHKSTIYTIEQKQEDGTYLPYTPEASAGVTTLSSVTNANIGDYIDLGNNIVGGEATSDDWRILYVDGNTIYAILADYLPNSTNYATNAGLNTTGTYGVYSNTDENTLINGLKTTSSWIGLANGINGATVTGAPTAKLLIDSYNAKNGTTINYTSEPILNSGSTDYNLYVPHTSVESSCEGYWLATLNENYEGGLWSACYHGTVSNGTYNYTSYGVRPVVALTSSTPVTKNGTTWIVDATYASSGETEGTENVSQPSTLTETGEYKITVTTTDIAENVATSDAYTVKIDKVKPEITFDPMEEEEWKKFATVTVTGTDEHSGLVENAKLQYQWVLDGEEPSTSGWRELISTNEAGAETITWTVPSTASITLTGEYKLYVRAGITEDNVLDTPKNTSDQTSTDIFHFDNTKPIAGTLLMKLDDSSGETYRSNTWTLHSVYIEKVDGSDAHSGHNTTTYTVEEKQADGTYTTYIADQTDPITLTETGEYKITVTTLDNLNNTETRIYYVDIDKELPTIGSLTMKLDNSSGSNYTNDTWINKSVYVEVVNGEDAHSGHLKTSYSVTKDGESFLVNQTGPYTFETDGEYEITLTTEDKAGTSYSESGNKVSETYMVKIDKTDPELIITGEATGITDGLIRHFDAHNNLGYGYLDTITKWADLSGNHDADVNNITFIEAYATFNGSTSWANLGEVNVTDAVTLEASIKLNEVQTGKAIIMGNYEGQGMGIYLEDGKATAEIYVGTGYKKVTLDEVLDTNRIYNISATYDGSKLMLYIDGVLQAETEASGTIGAPNNSTVMAMGTNPSGTSANGEFANINLYSARIYGRALTQTEINQNLNADRISPEKLVAKDSSVTLSFIFTEGVTGFDAVDITVTNGTKGTIIPISTSEYKLNITDIEAEEDLLVEVAENSYIDRAGNNGNAPETVRTRDAEAPTVTITADPDESPTRSETITYTFTFSEPTVGFVTDDIAVTNGTKGQFTKISSTQFTLVVTNERTCLQTITVLEGTTSDDSGNVNVEESKSVKIDRSTPTITIVPDKTTNEDSEDGRAVKSQVIAIIVEDLGDSEEEEDLQSGLNPASVFEYYLSKDATRLVPAIPGETWKTYTDGEEFTIGEGLTGTYYIFVKQISDNAGNISYANGTMVEIEVSGVVETYHMFGGIEGYVFDNSTPTITVEPEQTTSDVSDDGKAVKNQSIMVSVVDFGTSGLSESNVYEYYLSDKEDELSGGEWTAYEGGVPITLGNGLTGTYYLFMKTVSDRVGNISDAHGSMEDVEGTTYHMFSEYVFDNSTPEIELNPDGNDTYQKAQSTEITVEEVGTAGINTDTFKYMWSQGEAAMSESNFDLLGTAFTNGTTVNISTGTGNDFYLWTIAKDKLGNTNIKKSEPFYLDNTKPTIGEVTPEPSSETTYTLKITDVLDVTGTPNQSGIKGYYVSKNSTPPTEATEWAATASRTTMDKWIPHTSSTITFESADERTVFYIWVIDNAGNISDMKEFDTSVIYFGLNDEEWFETFEEAVAAASNGDTITVLKDVTDNTSGTINKSIILETNGKTFEKEVSNFVVETGCSVEIVGTGTIKAKELDELFTVKGNLKITNGNVENVVSETVINNIGSGTIEIDDGAVKGNIYAGAGTLKLNGGEINGDIYGGNQLADVTTTNIILDGANVNGSIYGGNQTKNVGTANITLKSGRVVESVFGGSNKTVGTANITLDGATVQSNIYGGTYIEGSVTTANINIKSGKVENVFGGSNLGGVVYNANITIQGTAEIENIVNGGGNKADIGTSTTSGNVVINIAGGTIGGDVYGGSFDNAVYGNTTINIGKDAIGDEDIEATNLQIKGNIFAGGRVSGSTEYTSKTVTGTATINIDANGYTSFKFAQSIYGSGRYCTVGTSNVTIKNLGTTGTPHSLQAIQRVGTLTIDNSNLEIIGIADDSNANTEIAFTLNQIQKVKIKNGTTLHLRRGFNKVEEFNSLVDISGVETKAEVNIENEEITEANVTNRIYVYEGVNLIIAKQEYEQNVQLTNFGKVNGMTFFGMYARDRSTLAIKYDIYDPTSPANGELFALGSYVEGLYDSTGAITVDGFYTNVVTEDESSIIPQYIDVMTNEPTYQDWILGEKTYIEEVTLIAKRNRNRVQAEVPLEYFTQAGTEYNVSLFSVNSLEKGISLIEKADISTKAPTSDIANTTFSLSMKNSSGWKTKGETHFYTSDTTPIAGTTQYITDDSGEVPYFQLNLYNSINVDKDADCGLVNIVLLVKQVSEGDPTQGGIFKVAITVNIQTKNEAAELTTFSSESHIAAGKQYELITENEIYITDRSSMTYTVNVYPIGTYSSSDYRVLVSSYQLPQDTKITMIDYAEKSQPTYYYYKITGYDAIEDGNYIYKLSNFKLMGATSGSINYTNPNTSYSASGYEEYRFIIDFEDATVSATVTDQTIGFELREGSTNEVKNDNLTIDRFNIYKNKNTNLTLSATGDVNNNYQIVSDSQLKFNVISGISTKKDGTNPIEDTYYDEKKLGISIALYDESNNRVPYSKVRGTYYILEGIEYYPDATGVARIFLSDNMVRITEDIQVNISSTLLDTGTYKLRIENYASADGYFYGLSGENKVDTEIEVIDLTHGLQVAVEDVDRLIDAPTGKTYEGENNQMNFGITASDLIENANIRVILYKRDATFNNDLTYAGISYTKVDLQQYVTETLLKPENEGLISSEELQYLVSDEVAEQTLIQYVLKLKDNLATGGYKLAFELYGGNHFMGRVERHFVVTDLVNVN